MQRIGILALATLGLACASWDGDVPSPAVARNSDVVITLAELDDWVKESLLRERTDGGEAAKLYEVRAKALDSLIEKRVIASQAKQRDTTVDDLLASAGGAVAEEEIQTFFDENQADMREQPLEKVAPFILTHLEQRNRRETIAAWVKAAGVKIHLEPPRFEVAPLGPMRGAAD